MKTLFTLLVAIFFNFQIVKACSCGGFRSFAESVKGNNYVNAIIEFQVISSGANYIKVKILNEWKGSLWVGQEIKIWDYERKVVSSCGQPSVSVGNFLQDERIVAAISIKEGNSFDFTYDTADQVFIPLFACGRSTLSVEQDSVKGATFGSTNYFSGGAGNTTEYNMLYKDFLIRFAQVLSVGEDIELVSDEVTFYPNPTKDIIYIRNSSAGNFKIYDSRLSEVASGVYNGQSVDISKLTPGIYVLEYILNDKKIIRKFIKE